MMSDNDDEYYRQMNELSKKAQALVQAIELLEMLKEASCDTPPQVLYYLKSAAFKAKH